jgi:hypothetical protein
MRVPTKLARFAEKYRLRVKRDVCRDRIVRGKLGHLYVHDARLFGIVFEAPADNARSDRTLRARIRRATTAGFLLRQEGEFEAILLFDPSDKKQAALAIQLIQAKKIRRTVLPTGAQLRVRALFSSKVRSKRPCFDQKTNAVVGQRDNPLTCGHLDEGRPRDEAFQSGAGHFVNAADCSGSASFTLSGKTSGVHEE